MSETLNDNTNASPSFTVSEDISIASHTNLHDETYLPGFVMLIPANASPDLESINSKPSSYSTLITAPIIPGLLVISTFTSTVSPFTAFPSSTVKEAFFIAACTLTGAKKVIIIANDSIIDKTLFPLIQYLLSHYSVTSM